MYIVSVKNNFETLEKEYIRKRNAIKAAQKALKDGYVVENNPELWPWQRKHEICSVCIYDSAAPETTIEF